MAAGLGPVRLGRRRRLDTNGFSAAVIAAVGAGVMDLLLLVAVRTLFELRHAQRVV
jgi:hypothetical protein